MIRLVARTIAVVGMVAAVAEPGSAAELRVGGAWEVARTAGLTAGALGKAEDKAAGRDLRLGFTPRAGTGFGFGTETAPIEFDLEVAPAGAGLARLEALALVPGEMASGRLEASPRGLAVGGVLAWSGWTVGGSFVSGAVGTGGIDLWSGSIGYGPVVARLGYGQTTTVGGQERELWLFGTELTTRPWLTLEGDLAITSGAEREPAAAGRLGLRLNF